MNFICGELEGHCDECNEREARERAAWLKAMIDGLAWAFFVAIVIVGSLLC
jgi:hypothetical protein